MHPAPPAPPAIVIAAGGEGERIGGGKPARQLGDRRLIDHAIGWARARSDCVALAVRRDMALPGADLPLLTDREDSIGPIAALASAAAFAAAQGRRHVLLIGCDMPFLPDDLIHGLSRAITDAAAAIPRRAGRLHTLAGLWRSDPAAVAQWIAGGGRSLWGYAEGAGLVVVDWPEAGADPFANINTPEDLAAAEARLRGPAR